MEFSKMHGQAPEDAGVGSKKIGTKSNRGPSQKQMADQNERVIVSRPEEIFMTSDAFRNFQIE
jgi:hypothetical protein